jgi:hypothetical protein
MCTTLDDCFSRLDFYLKNQNTNLHHYHQLSMTSSFFPFDQSHLDEGEPLYMNAHLDAAIDKGGDVAYMG